MRAWRDYGPGFEVVLVDEWESVEQLTQFFGNPELQAFTGSPGQY